MSESQDAAEKPVISKARPAGKYPFRFIYDFNVPQVTVALLGICMATWLGIRKIDSAEKAVSQQIGSAERKVLVQQYVINFPANGDSVELTDIIRGRTPFLDQNSYVIVTPLKVGVDFVQEGPVKISKEGSWAAQTRFGTGEVGLGEKFLVRAMATKSTLQAGPLTNVPEDAVFSDSITVTRR